MTVMSNWHKNAIVALLTIQIAFCQAILIKVVLNLRLNKLQLSNHLSPSILNALLWLNKPQSSNHLSPSILNALLWPNKSQSPIDHRILHDQQKKDLKNWLLSLIEC